MREGRVSKPRPDLSVIPIREAQPILSAWIRPRIPLKLIHTHEKISDADLLALAILRYLHKMPYFSRWWHFLKVEVRFVLPSLTQAHVRLKRLLPVLETLLNEVESLDFALIDSEPIPVCRFKRAKHCKFPQASFGFTTQGMIYGFKLHAWALPNGRIVRYLIRPAHEHDLNAGEQMNADWPTYGGPKIIGDKAYVGGGYITPPKTNARYPDLRWRDEYHAARKAIESAFSSVAGRGLRWGQVKTIWGLRLKVALVLIAYNLRFQNFGPVNP
ncbi:IS982 family transposase [Deinococcus cavernae]|uniref:IS982 family transposase n=2 Tax=Deinococcus cavernae TaxID=2320857 RepID=A0A418VGT2_9DEIO|nr:IS982 family transposase [Deinococcus cavernae]